MVKDQFGFGIKAMNMYGNANKVKKRTLGIRDKQILYQRAKSKCEACGRKIEFSEMQSGHKTAAAKGGNATLRNSVCLCYKCNKLQGTDSWSKFNKKLGKSTVRSVTSGKRSTKKKPKRNNIQSNSYDLLGIKPVKFPKFKMPKYKF